MNNIPIVFCFNDSYLIPAGVSIYSLLRNAKKDTFLDIYVFYSDNRLGNNSKNQILKLKETHSNCKISFINIGNLFSKAYEVQDFSIENYFRLAIPNQLGHFEKVMYCDSDTIFTKDIYEIFTTDISKQSIGAVKDGLASSNKNFQLYLQNNNIDYSHYINSGVLIFNNNKINSNGGIECKIKYLLKRIFRYVDQDILNIAYSNDIYFLNSSYNYTLQHLINGEHLSPHIIHYAKQKPWKQPSAFGDIWWSYYRESPFYDEQYYLTQTKKIYADIDKHIAIGSMLKKIGIYNLIIKIKWILTMVNISR